MHITKWKKPTWKGFILNDSNYMTFGKRQNYRDNKKISGCRGQGGGKDEGAGTEDFYDNDTTLYGTIQWWVRHTFVQTQGMNTRSEPYCILWTWLVMIYQHRLINHKNKCTTLVEDVDDRRDYVCVGAGHTWEASVPPFRFVLSLKLL